MLDGIKNSFLLRSNQFLALLVAFFWAGGFAFATNIELHDESGNILKRSGGGDDLLLLETPNQDGISVNYFKNFTVGDRPLKLLNLHKTVESEGGQEKKLAARVAIIIADEFHFNNSVSLVGPAADIVFLTNNKNGNITCVSCSFNNFLRISFIAAKASNEINRNSRTIDEVSTQDDEVTSVSIDSLYAPGAIAIDLFADNVQVDGEISSNTIVMKDARGGYTATPAGNLIMASGQINLIIGEATWNYDEQRLIDVNESVGDWVLDGKIASASIKISSSKNLYLRSMLDTRADVFSAINYNDSVFAPKESVEVYIFGGNSLTVGGYIYSNGIVNLSSHGDLIVSAGSTLQSHYSDFIAGNKLINFGLMKSEFTSIAGDKIFNEGKIESSAELEVFAVNELFNQYGGLVSGDKILLSSESSIVRNGSRTPYRSQDVDSSGLLKLSKSGYPINDDGTSKLTQDTSSNLGGLSYFNSTQLGTYYALEREVDSVTGVDLPEEQTAHIVANDLKITARAFENINPYYVPVHDEPEILVKGKELGQVLIAAENSIEIQASRYILNSSAAIYTMSPSGSFTSNTSLFANERYRTQSVLNHKIVESIDDTEIEDIVIEDEIISTKVIAYSPPGRIVSMGDFITTAGQGIYNNTGYVEVYGDAELHTALFYDIGLENQAVTNRTVTDYNYGEGRRKAHIYSSDALINPNELNSLFYVNGNFFTNAVNADGEDVSAQLFTSHNTLEHYVEQITDQLEQKYSSTDTGTRTTYSPGEFSHLSVKKDEEYIIETTAEVSSDLDAVVDGNLIVNKTIHKINNVTETIEDDESGDTEEVKKYIEDNTRETQVTVSLWDEVKRLWLQLEDFISEMITDIKDWWNS